MFKRLKFAQKLWILSILIISLITFGFYSYFKTSLEKKFQIGLENKANTLTQTAASNLGAGLHNSDSNFLREILSGLESDPDVSFVYISDDKKQMKYGYKHYEYQDIIQSTLNSNQIEKLTPDFFIIKRSVFYQEKYQGDIIVGFNLNWVRKNMNRIVRQLWILGVVLGLLSILLAYLFSRGLTRPLTDIAATVNSYSNKEDLSELRFPVNGRDEVAQLSSSLNHLSDKIEHNLKELSNSKKYLETLFQLSPIPILTADTMGKIEGANESANNFFDVENHVLLQMNLDHFFQSNDLNAIFNRIVQDGQEIKGYITTLKMTDGAKKVVELNISSHQDEFNYVKSIIVAIIDVTQKIQIQREILHNQTKLQRINKELTLKTEEAHRLSAWNKRNAYNLSQLINSSQRMMRAAEPEQIMQEIIKNGIDLFEAEECIIYFWDTKTNRLIPSMTSPKHIIDRLIPVTKEERNFIWETYEENDAFVRDSEELNRIDFNLMAIDPSKKVSLVSVPISEKDYRFGVILFLKYFEHAFRVEDVHLLSTLANQAAILLDNMHLVHAIQEKAASLEHAYSDLQKSQQQVVQLQKMESLGTLVGGIAHDFNNILGIIIPNTDLLKNEVNGNLHSVRRVQIIAEAAQRAANLTKQLLMFSRNQDLKTDVLNVNRFIDHLATMLQGTLGTEYEIILNLDDHISDIEADETRLTQVLINLAVNARDAMPAGGEIRLKTFMKKYQPTGNKNLPEKEYVCISISDTGKGIKKENLDKIFDPFFTTKSVGKGTGLGLSVVYGMMQSHNGFVEVESQLNKGTTFFLYLPPSPRKRKLPEKKKVVPIPHGSEKILLIDDENMLRSSVKEILASIGYNVTTASSGIEGVSLVEKNRRIFSLAIVDMSMPKMNGIETIRRIQKLDNSVKIILSSGHLDRDKIIPRELKIDGTLPKPYRMRDLANKIRQVLNMKN